MAFSDILTHTMKWNTLGKMYPPGTEILYIPPRMRKEEIYPSICHETFHLMTFSFLHKEGVNSKHRSFFLESITEFLTQLWGTYRNNYGVIKVSQEEGQQKIKKS
jgi:hypothetical protein